MQTFEQALFEAVKAGKVTMDDAMAARKAPARLQALMQTDGRRGTTMERRRHADDHGKPERDTGEASRAPGVRV